MKREESKDKTKKGGRENFKGGRKDKGQTCRTVAAESSASFPPLPDAATMLNLRAREEKRDKERKT